MNLSQFNSSFSQSPCSTSSSLFSHSPFVDITKCNQHKFFKSVTRGLKRYLTCFKPMKSVKGNTKGCVSSTFSDVSEKHNCNYYREMNDEEREENLQSVIRYCKGSGQDVTVKQAEKQSSESETMSSNFCEEQDNYWL